MRQWEKRPLALCQWPSLDFWGWPCTCQVSSDKSLALSGISFHIYRKRVGPRISTEAQTVGGPREFPCWPLQSLENSPNAGRPPPTPLPRAGVHPSDSHELGPSGLNAMLEPKPSSYPGKAMCYWTIPEPSVCERLPLTQQISCQSSVGNPYVVWILKDV